MAKFQVVMTKQESEDILISYVRKNFGIPTKVRLQLDVINEEVHVSSMDVPTDKESWLGPEEF